MVNKKYITHQRDPFFQIALDYITSNSKVLDIGAGDGTFAKFCKNEDFYLYDGNLETVYSLKKNFRHSYFGKLPELPFDDDFFDLIHCSHVVEHLHPQELYDSLVQMDRVLKTNGYLVISTPLLWEGFYDDLSHVKPYSPFVFLKYLCGKSSDNLTRFPISVRYEMESLIYRYRDSSKRQIYFNRGQNIFVSILLSILFRMKKWGFMHLEKTGYTIVLKKGV